MKLKEGKTTKKTMSNKCSGRRNFSCRHPKLWEYIKSNVKAFLITGAITFTITASAITVKILHSSQVRYKDDKSVEQAINELYEKAYEDDGYHIGDEITVNGIAFYVIVDSSATQDYVVALKKEPLTVAEVNTYGVGHLNRYASISQGTAYNSKGYGAIAYYSSAACGRVNNDYFNTECKNDYDQSEIKYVIDNWSNAIFINNELKTVEGYGARLAQKEELRQIGWASCSSNTSYCAKRADTPDWIWSSNYWYWTMTPYNNSSSDVFDVGSDGSLYYYRVYNGGGLVRPVINVYKASIQK